MVVGLVLTTCFTLIRFAPGDPFFVGLDATDVPRESADLMRERIGYDKPVPEQFLRFIGAVARGDLG